MNNQTKRIYTLVQDNYVLVVDTSLNSFYKKITHEDIGIKLSISTIRNRFKRAKWFSELVGRRVFHFQKIENKK